MCLFSLSSLYMFGQPSVEHATLYSKIQHCNHENLMAMCLHFSLLMAVDLPLCHHFVHTFAHMLVHCKYAGCKQFRRLFNLIEIYSVCAHVGLSFVSSRIAFALYIFTSNNLSSPLVCHPFIWTDFGWSDDGLQKNLCARISFTIEPRHSTHACQLKHTRKDIQIYELYTL